MSKSYEQQIAEAVLSACEAEDGPIEEVRRNLDAIIASVPRPEPVGEVKEDCNGHPWKRLAYTSEHLLDSLPIGAKVYAAPVSAEPVNIRCHVCGYQHGHAIGCSNNPMGQKLVNARLLDAAKTLCAAWKRTLYVNDLVVSLREAIATAEQAKPAQELTDVEVGDLADDFKSQYTHAGTLFDHFDYSGFARAVIAADRELRGEGK